MEKFNTIRDVARELARKYSTMTHSELDILESILVPRKYLKGQMILSEGEVCKDLLYVAKGMTRQFYFKNGKELTEHMSVEGGIVMCIESLFKEEPTRLQIEALEPTWVFAMPKARLEEVALHNVNIQILYRKILEESLIVSQVHADLVRQVPEDVQDYAAGDTPGSAYLYCQLSADDTGDVEPRAYGRAEKVRASAQPACRPCL